MAVKEIRGVKIGYEETGKGAPLVFVHGHPFDRSMWCEQRAAFDSKYRIIAPDLRGYGESEISEDVTMLEEFAHDIAALLNDIKADDIILCGLSMGGQILFEFYHLFPQRVRALVLADTFAQLDDPERKQSRYDTAERFLKEGMHDSVSDAEFMRDRIPNSKMAVIEGAGHMPNLENPVEFNRILDEFMETLK